MSGSKWNKAVGVILRVMYCLLVSEMTLVLPKLSNLRLRRPYTVRRPRRSKNAVLRNFYSHFHETTASGNTSNGTLSIVIKTIATKKDNNKKKDKKKNRAAMKDSRHHKVKCCMTPYVKSMHD